MILRGDVDFSKVFQKVIADLKIESFFLIHLRETKSGSVWCLFALYRGITSLAMSAAILYFPIGIEVGTVFIKVVRSQKLLENVRTNIVNKLKCFSRSEIIIF